MSNSVIETIEATRLAEARLAAALRMLAETQRDNADVAPTCMVLAERCEKRSRDLAVLVTRRQNTSVSYESPPPSQLSSDTTAAALLEDFRSLYFHGCAVLLDWMILKQRAQVARDAELVTAALTHVPEVERVNAWVKTRIKVAAAASTT